MPRVSLTLWSVIRTPIFRSFKKRIILWISPTAIGSTHANGSSKRTNFGFVASALAMHCSTSHFTSPEQNEDHVLAEQNWIQAMHQLHQSEWDQQDTKVPFDMSNIYLHVNYIRLNVVNILDTLGPMTIPPSMDTRWVYFNHLRRILATQCAMTHQYIPILDTRLETHLDLKYAVVGRRLSSFIRYYSQWFM